MKLKWQVIDRLLAVLSLGLAVASAVIHDVDKSPIYLLLAYILFRLS